MTSTEAEEIDGGDGKGRTKKSANGSKKSGDGRCEGQMRLDDESDDGTDSSAAGDAENVRVRQRIAQQGLKAGTGYGKRCADKNREKNARQANVKNNELVFARELAGLAKKNAEEIVAEAVERDGHSAELERDHYHYEKNGG